MNICINRVANDHIHWHCISHFYILGGDFFSPKTGLRSLQEIRENFFRSSREKNPVTQQVLHISKTSENPGRPAGSESGKTLDIIMGETSTLSKKKLNNPSITYREIAGRIL